MSGHKSVGPLKGMCDISATGILTCVKSLGMMFESVCVTVSEQFAIADRFFLFL
jgi:hypothetical protein